MGNLVSVTIVLGNIVDPKWVGSVVLNRLQLAPTMHLRYLAILIFLLPTARSAGWTVQQTAHRSGNSSCCEVIEVASCCDVEVIEPTCPASDEANEACVCVSDPSEYPDSNSVPILPQTIGHLILGIPDSGDLIVWTLPVATGQSTAGWRTKEVRILSTNQAQSMLGNWRI